MTGPAPGEPAEVPPGSVPDPLPAEEADPVPVGRDPESARMRVALVFVLYLGFVALLPVLGLLLRLRR